MLFVAIYSNQITYPNHATGPDDRGNVVEQVLVDDPHMYP